MQYPYPNSDLALGACFQLDGHVLFRLWAPEADAVSLWFWAKSWTVEPAESPVCQLDCQYDPNSGTWFLNFWPPSQNLAIPLYYQYAVRRAGLTLSVLDPWALGADLSTGDEPPRACLLPLEMWYNPPTPVADDGRYSHPAQAIIYEAHIRDLTISPDSPVPQPEKGTYFGAIAALDQIADLGVSHLQLLPLQLFGRTNEGQRNFEFSTRPADHNYNWGYDPVSYFIVSGWYARNPEDPLSRIRDLQQLVGAAHQRGLRVILDVVYNHMASTQIFEHLAPGYWFRRQIDGSFCSNSGCGNDLETTQPMFRRLLRESLTHLLQAFDVDGFRFDLMGMIDEETMRAAYTHCAAIKPDVLFIGEGWKLYNGPPGTSGMDQNALCREQPVAAFNDEFRDLMKGGGMNELAKGFLHGRKMDYHALYQNLQGAPVERYTALHPWNNVNYLECHDGLTLHDNLAVNLQLDPTIAGHQTELIRRCALGNFLLALSQGIGFFHAGQELGRTKPLPSSTAGYEAVGNYVHNSYRAGDSVNALPWQLSREQLWLRDWTKAVLKLRWNHGLLRAQWPENPTRNFQTYDQGRRSVLAWTMADSAELVLCAVNASRRSQTIQVSAAVRDCIIAAQARKAIRCLADRQTCSWAGIESPKGYKIEDGILKLSGLTAIILSIET